MQEWIVGPTSQEDYLGRVGAERLLWLKGKARPDSWQSELLTAERSLIGTQVPTPAERMIIAAAHLIAEKVTARGHRSVLSGLGAANLACLVGPQPSPTARRWGEHRRFDRRDRLVCLHSAPLRPFPLQLS